jgi:hypothetical protein
MMSESALTVSRPSRLIRPELASSHAEWAANKNAAERVRLAEFASWKAQQRREQDEKAHGQLTADAIRNSNKGGWVGLCVSSGLCPQPQSMNVET